jgi:4-hydroxy-tetrahydrodipicolinate reductase
MDLRIIVNGAGGKMGQEAVKAVEKESGLALVGQLQRNNDLEAAIRDTKADIVIDFTSATVAAKNCETIIQSGAHPVVGTTGFQPNEITALQKLCENKKLGGIIAPNFSIAVVLMIRCATELVKYFPHVEIIELHHNKKVDAPSGTAIKTAEMLSANKEATTSIEEKQLIAGARGAVKNDIHIHSVRLPGLVAHEEIIFGDIGQTLTLRHDTYNREAFMPGVILACHKVKQLNKLVYGLENIL